MVKTNSKWKSRQALVNTVFCDCDIMSKLHLKTPDKQPVIYKRYELYIYASKYKGKFTSKLSSTSLTALSDYSFYLWLTLLGYPTMCIQRRLLILSTGTFNRCKLSEMQVAWIAIFLHRCSQREHSGDAITQPGNPRQPHTRRGGHRQPGDKGTLPELPAFTGQKALLASLLHLDKAGEEAGMTESQRGISECSAQWVDRLFAIPCLLLQQKPQLALILQQTQTCTHLSLFNK